MTAIIYRGATPSLDKGICTSANLLTPELTVWLMRPALNQIHWRDMYQRDDHGVRGREKGAKSTTIRVLLVLGKEGEGASNHVIDKID